MFKKDNEEFIRNHICPVCYKKFKLTFSECLGMKMMTVEVSCKHRKEITRMIDECLK
ncbi:MAG: hypothetical protein ACI3T9_07710 [Romboutsia timonensis]